MLLLSDDRLQILNYSSEIVSKVFIQNTSKITVVKIAFNEDFFITIDSKAKLNTWKVNWHLDKVTIQVLMEINVSGYIFNSLSFSQNSPFFTLFNKNGNVLLRNFALNSFIVNFETKCKNFERIILCESPFSFLLAFKTDFSIETFTLKGESIKIINTGAIIHQYKIYNNTQDRSFIAVLNKNKDSLEIYSLPFLNKKKEIFLGKNVIQDFAVFNKTMTMCVSQKMFSIETLF